MASWPPALTAASTGARLSANGAAFSTFGVTACPVLNGRPSAVPPGLQQQLLPGCRRRFVTSCHITHAVPRHGPAARKASRASCLQDQLNRPWLEDRVVIALRQVAVSALGSTVRARRAARVPACWWGQRKTTWFLTFATLRKLPALTSLHVTVAVNKAAEVAMSQWIAETFHLASADRAQGSRTFCNASR